MIVKYDYGEKAQKDAALLALQIKAGGHSPGVWAMYRFQKRQGNRFFLQRFQEEPACQHLDFTPVKQSLDF